LEIVPELLDSLAEMANLKERTIGPNAGGIVLSMIHLVVKAAKKFLIKLSLLTFYNFIFLKEIILDLVLTMFERAQDISPIGLP